LNIYLFKHFKATAVAMTSAFVKKRLATLPNPAYYVLSVLVGRQVRRVQNSGKEITASCNYVCIEEVSERYSIFTTF
jgi:hypothetical protein